jgi:hypothetical protein
LSVSLESVNSLGRLEGYTFIFPPGALSDPEKINRVHLTLPSGLTAQFVRVHHWEKVKKEEAELAEIHGSDSTEGSVLADITPVQSLETRSQPNPV